MGGEVFYAVLAGQASHHSSGLPYPQALGFSSEAYVSAGWSEAVGEWISSGFYRQLCWRLRMGFRQVFIVSFVGGLWGLNANSILSTYVDHNLF